MIDHKSIHCNHLYNPVCVKNNILSDITKFGNNKSVKMEIMEMQARGGSY